MDWSLFLSKFSSANPNLDAADDGLFLRGASDLHTINGPTDGRSTCVKKEGAPVARRHYLHASLSLGLSRPAISGIFLPDFPFAKSSGSAQKRAKSSPYKNK